MFSKLEIISCVFLPLKGVLKRLSPEERAYLARELLASLDAMGEADIERLWVDEAIRRDDEIDKSTSKTYPAEEVLARARARLK